jgi:hypothetical protein
VRTHPKSRSLPVEDLKTLAINGSFLDPKTFTPAQPGSANQTITFTAAGQPTIDFVDDIIYDEGALPPASFTDLPYSASSRFATVGSLLELTIKNNTASHHPWHPHGFVIQPVRFVDNATGETLWKSPTTSSSTPWTFPGSRAWSIGSGSMTVRWTTSRRRAAPPGAGRCAATSPPTPPSA